MFYRPEKIRFVVKLITFIFFVFFVRVYTTLVGFRPRFMSIKQTYCLENTPETRDYERTEK